jgi:zinc and cadmium transporter
MVNLAFALVTPLGALLFYLGAGPWAHTHPLWLGAALAFCAGTFLCIASSDLLPELQFHRHDRLKLSAALLVGLLVAIGITRFGHAEQQSTCRTRAFGCNQHPTWLKPQRASQRVGSTYNRQLS